MAKPKRVSFPREEFIINCIENNRDGFSMAWNENKTLYNFQTLNPEKALQKYKELAARLDPDKSAMIFHARIATHGNVTLSNCHCSIEDAVAFAHNGILSIAATKGRTDSQTYFQDTFLKIKKAYGIKAAYDNARKVIGASRFAFLRPNGDLILMGDWVSFCDIPKGTAHFSNTSFQRRSYFRDFMRFDHIVDRGRFHRLPTIRNIAADMGEDLEEDFLENTGTLFPIDRFLEDAYSHRK